MSNLERKKLGDVIDLVIDNRGRNPKSYSTEGIPVIDNFLIKSDGMVDLGEVNRYIDEETYSNFLRKYVAEGDVIMTLVGNGYGKVATAPSEKCAIIQNTIGLRCNESNDNAFLYYLLKYNRESLTNLDRGAAQPSIKVGDVLNLEFYFPTTRRQTSIGRILGAIDKKIELNRRMNETLESIARAIFKSWFVDFDPVRTKLEGQSHEQQSSASAYPMPAEVYDLFPSAFQDSALGKIPEGWEVSNVGENFDLVMGQSPPGDTYNELGEGIPFYQGRRDFGFRFPSRRVFCTQPKRLAQAGDTLVSVRAPVGDLNVASEECCLGRGLAGVRHRSDAPTYTYYSMHALKADFDRYDGEGTVFGSINQTNFKAITVVTPASVVVTAFENMVSHFDKLLRVNSEEINTLADVRDTLLPKLLSGELTVPDAHLQAEEVL